MGVEVPEDVDKEEARPPLVSVLAEYAPAFRSICTRDSPNPALWLKDVQSALVSVADTPSLCA